MCLQAQESLVKYELTNLEVNNKYPSFGLSFYNNQIVFTGTKNGYNYNLFIINEDDTSLNKSLKFSKSDDLYSNVALTKDKKTLYFTKSIYGKKNTLKKNKNAYLGIYRATLSTKGVWENIKPLPFNSNKYDVAHPTLNKDNSILYFTSNMPGTIGNNDIFEVVIHEDGSYSEPRNLGPNVNTKNREMFPFIASDNFLYFSSDNSMENFGGLDIYYVKINGSTTTKKIHLNAPINSKADDFSYIFNPELRIGYLNSNRQGGKGDDDIYSFKEKKIKIKEKEEKKKECDQKVIGIVHRNNNINNVASGALVVLKSENGQEIETKTTRSNARFYFNIKCNKNYSLTASRDGLLKKTNTFKAGNKHLESIKNNINLDLNETVKKIEIISGKINFSFNDINLGKDHEYQLEKATILMRQNPNLNVLIESHTDSRGDDEINMQLTEKRVASVSNYFTSNGVDNNRVITKAFGETKLLNKCKNKVKCTTKEHLTNRRTTYELIQK